MTMLRRLPSEACTEDIAWTLLLALRRRIREGRPVLERTGLRLDDRDELVEVPATQGWIVARPDLPEGWTGPEHGASVASNELGERSAIVRLLDLYMPLCVGARCRELVVGHLAQSLDGRIATVGGVSQFITGEENLKHAHRMRALCDAVLVGARTVEHDNPRLTTRHVPGPNPCRVVLDPRGRLSGEYALFSDGNAPTLVVVGKGGRPRTEPMARDGVEVVAIDEFEGRLPATRVLEELRRRGMGRLFVEGGGITISRLFQAGALDRLHIAVAPLIMGSGRPSFALPVIERLSDATRVQCRHFRMGDDVLFDCDLR